MVREAKKMVSTTSHIPRKKLIELVDMNQGDLTDDTYDMRDVKDKLIAKFQVRILSVSNSGTVTALASCF